MLIWVDSVARHGRGSGPTVTYGSLFFRWLHGKLLMMEEYSHAGTKFRGDPKLPLPEDDQWDDRGKKDVIFIVFFIF